MERKKYSREFKLETVNLVKERGVAIVQARVTLISTTMFCTDGSKSLPLIPRMSFQA